MNKRLYVGNLPYSTTDDQLRDLFELHGPTESANVIVDRETGRSRGFGFVEFQEPSGALAAQEALDGTDLNGRPLRVNVAHEKRRSNGR